MRPVYLLPCLLASLLLQSACSRPFAAEAEVPPHEDHDLVGTMGDLQRWTDKLGRAAEAGNWTLADFYLHEIEETTEALTHAGIVYHNQPVSQLAGLMLQPAVDTLETALKTRDAAQINTAYGTFVQTCNACHATTGYDFIRIAPPSADTNPWNQDFSPAL